MIFQLFINQTHNKMKKTIRVEIPISSPDESNKLSEYIATKIKELGDKSPIDKETANLLTELAKKQREKRNESNKLHAQAQAATQDADIALGIADGQNVNTPDTMYNVITLIRDILLVKYRGREEMLSEFGFNVVVGSAKSPTKKADEAEE